MLHKKSFNSTFLRGILALLLLSASLHAVTDRFVTDAWRVDNDGNVTPVYIPFGESRDESLQPCFLEVSGLPDDEQIIHDYTDDTFSWTCGPIGGAGATAAIRTSETDVPDNITQSGIYTLTFTGSTKYYIQKSVNGAPVLDGPFTATLEPVSEHYSLSRPVYVVEVLCITGHGKTSTRKSAPLEGGEGASRGTGDNRNSDSALQAPAPANRDGEAQNAPGTAPWTDPETIYAQPYAKINLSMRLKPELEMTNAVIDKVSWDGSENITVNADDPKNVMVTPTVFGKKTIVASFGSNRRVMQIRCVPMAVHEVDFTNDIPIKRDTTGIAYSGAAWKDNDMDGDSDLEGQNADADKNYQPVAYCSTDSLSAMGKFRPNEKKADGTLLQESDYDAVADVKRVRYSIVYAPFTVSDAVAYNASGTVVNGYQFAGIPYVAYYPSWSIIWYIGFGESDASDDALVWNDSQSTHELYLTYNGRISSYETVFHVGCTGANGLTSETDIVNAIFTNKFASTHLKRKGSTNELTYYGTWASSSQYGESGLNNQGSFQLLSHEDGRCGDWACFLNDIYQIHGINTTPITLVPESQVLNYGISSDGFIVKNIQFPDIPDISGPYPYIFRRWMLNRVGIKGQGELNTPGAKIFDNHEVVRYNNYTFDPSYGIVYDNAETFCNDFESRALDAYVKSSANGLNCGKTNIDNVIEN